MGVFIASSCIKLPSAQLPYPFPSTQPTLQSFLHSVLLSSIHSLAPVGIYSHLYEPVSLLINFSISSASRFHPVYFILPLSKMVSKVVIIAAIVAYVEARFGQEQIPISAIAAVKGGSPGAAGTISGAAISDLLGAANACAKVRLLERIHALHTY